jgi:hypothetical protein
MLAFGEPSTFGTLIESLPRGEHVAHAPDERSIELLEPVIAELLTKSGPGRFSTRALIEALQSFPEGQRAYEEALAVAGEEARSEQMARQILHGQVVPDILRHSRLVRFQGFIHGAPDEDDGYGIPSWWERIEGE